MSNQPRYLQLDGLRGIAALTVVISHFTLLTPLLRLRHTPLRLVSGGHEAVILFFTLSGFVLALQISGTRPMRYDEYAVRRICRIFIPYIVSILVAFAAFSTFYRGSIDWAGPWFNGGWPATISASELAWHAGFIFPFQTDRMNPVIWSLVYEMRISLIFPLVMIFLIRAPVWIAIAMAALASILISLLSVVTNHPIIQASVAGEWLPTIHYLLMFVVGAALAKHRTDIQSFMSSRPRGSRVWACASLGAALLYVGSRPVSLVTSGVFSDFLFDWIVLVAVSGLICAAIAFAPFDNFLRTRPILFLGRISYSLYLYHALVLFSVVHLLGSKISIGASLAIAALLIVPVSYLAYVLVERPGMKLGSALGKRMAARQADRREGYV